MPVPARLRVKPGCRFNFGANPEAVDWDGPTVRPTFFGYAHRYEPGLEADFALNAGRRELVWIYVVTGAMVYTDSRVASQVIGKGSAFLAIQPNQGRLTRRDDGVPCEFLIVQMIGPTAVAAASDMIDRYGCFFRMRPSSAPVTGALSLVDLLRARAERSAHFWSVRAYRWLLSLDQHLAENPNPDARAYPLPSPMVPVTQGTLRDYAGRIGYSASHMSRKLRRVWGVAPGGVLRRAKAEEAARLLRSTGMAVKDIAREVGYRSSSAFNHAFVRCYGQTPLAYRHASR